ncbi:Coq4 family protein [Sphingomonas montanisoli]|nr:Coq4 family protein [Sphingomonas montanisoli]
MKAEADRKILDSYLGAGVKRETTDSSLLISSSRYLNNPQIRDIIATWLLRKNGPDFPVEADHTLGLSTAMAQVNPAHETAALMEEERKINPAFDAWLKEGFISTYTNDDFHKYAPGTVGGIISKQIKERGFDIQLGLDLNNFDPSNAYDYWRVRSRQTHDFEHIITGGQFNSLGEIPVIFGRTVNEATHLSPALASRLAAYTMFAGLRMISRSLLHYPETWPMAMRLLEQGIRVGRESPPFWFFRWEEVFHLTPAEARVHFGMPEAEEIECFREASIFREDPEMMALAAE